MIKEKSGILVLLIALIINTGSYAQKKLRTKDQLAKATIYRSLDDAMLNKKRVYILNLDSKNLTELPSQIGKLKNLQELYLRGNKLTSLPPELWELTNLQKLMLGDNKLSEVPAAISKLINLEELDLFSNRLKTLPDAVTQLIHLKKIISQLESVRNITC